MRIISVTQTNIALRVVAEESAGQIREFVFGEADDGTIVIHWGDIDTEPELETFTAYDGNNNQVFTHTVTKDEEKPVKCVEWLALPIEEAIDGLSSGKWEVQFFNGLSWRPFIDGNRVYDGTRFRGRPKPGEHG